MKTRIINRSEVEILLTPEECRHAMKQTLTEISAGESAMLARRMIKHKNGNMLAIMPSSLTARARTGAKVIIFPGADMRGKATPQGIIPLFDSDSGRLLAIADGEHITGVRTAAVSAAATDALANPDARTLGILGAGRLGRMHIEAIMPLRDIRKVYIWDTGFEFAQKLADDTAKKYGVEAIACKLPHEAVVDSDIVCTVTSAKEYFLEGKYLKKGAHINAVGACSAAVREIDAEAVSRSRFFSDQTAAVLEDAGDLLLAIKEGAVTAEHIVGEIGKVFAGELEGRRTHDEITLFESVGLAPQDLAAANLVYEKALAQNMGIDVEF